MNIFYAAPDQIFDNSIQLIGSEAHHAANVLRYKKGDEIVVVDGVGNRYNGMIDRISKKQVTIAIQHREVIQSPTETVRKLVLVLGIIKNRQRLEFAVEKAVELNVSEIVLLESRYTEKSKVRLDRLESIMISAMKQSMHAFLPAISKVSSIETVLNEFPDYIPLIAHEKFGGMPGLPELHDSDNMLLFVGPEGGFSEEEVDFVQERGGKIVSLGRYRLRAETAAIAFLSLFLSK